VSAGYDVLLRNAQLDAITTYIGSAGKMIVYAGTRPATSGAAGTVLATLTMGTPFAAGAASAVLTAGAIASAVASATGTGAWARLFKSNGTTICIDLGVGTSGQEVTIGTTAIVSGATVSCSSLVITRGNA
jgi:hypothetical protein